MKITKIFALILAILMVLPILIACNKDDGEEGGAVGTIGTVTGSDGEVLDLDPKLEAEDMGEFSFGILAHDTVPYVAEEFLGTAINDAVYERNLYLQEKYNIVIDVQSVKENAYRSEVEKHDESGLGDISIVTPGVAYAFQLATEGFLLELPDVPYVNLDKAYWWQYVTDDCSFNGKKYVGINDSNQRTFYQIAICMFNKDIMIDNKMENFYDLVKDGKWTFDKFIELSKSAYSDTTGDGRTLDDTYGLTGNSWMTDCFISGWDMRLIGKDASDLPVINLTTDDSLKLKFVTAFDKMSALFNDPTTAYGEHYKHVSNARQVVPQELFEDGRCLFWVESVGWTENLRKLDLAFGLLPVPKVDEQQEFYTNDIHSWTSSTTCVLRAASQNIEKVGKIVEDMAYASNYFIRPAYYDVLLAGQTVYDEESYEMLPYILDHCRIDMAVTLRQAGVTMLDDFRNVATAQGSITRCISMYGSGWQTKIDQLKERI